MSKYAQLITSFERTGSFPLEANYIFKTPAELQAFYADEVAAATMHKGLLRIVEDNGSGKQAVWWVTPTEDKTGLECKELISGGDIHELQNKLSELAQKVADEAAARDKADEALWGTPDRGGVDGAYNSIADLALQVQRLQQALEELSERAITAQDSVKSQLKGVVGTEENDLVAYLQKLPYHTLTEVIKVLDSIVNRKEDSPTDKLETLPELSDFLEGYSNKDTLKQTLHDLWHLIEGAVLPSEKFRTLRGIEDWLIEAKTEDNAKHRTEQEEIDYIERSVGLDADGGFTSDPETHYLDEAVSVMNALRILDAKLHAYASANTPSVRNTDPAMDLRLTQELDSYVFSGRVNLSGMGGNQIKRNTDGLYFHTHFDYKDGVLTQYVNEQVISRNYIGLTAVVETAFYDKDNEQLVFRFKLESGDIQTVCIPVKALIREWAVRNDSSSPVVLSKDESVPEADALSARLRLYFGADNLLSVEGGALYAKGYAEKIHYGDVTLDKWLEKEHADNMTRFEGVDDNLRALKNADRETDTRVTELEKTQEGLKAGLLEETHNRELSASEEKHQRELADAALQGNIDKETSERLRLQDAVDDNVRKTDELAKTVEELPEYAIRELDTPGVGCVKSYYLTKGGEDVLVRIDVPDTPIQWHEAAEYLDAWYEDNG